MGVLQWLFLILAIVGVISVYIVVKRKDGPDPWQDMRRSGQSDDESPAEALLPAQSSGSEQHLVDTNFDGMLGANDIPDLPADSAPSLDDEPLPGFDVKPEPVAEISDDEPELRPSAVRREVESAEQRILVLHVATTGEYFQGEAIHAALKEAKLLFGMQDVYHRLTEENGIPETVYSVANMLKPGFLNPDEAASLETPGLTMFMMLPGPMDGVQAFKDMMETANQVAQKLGGEVLDDKRATLNRQTAQYLLDQIAEDQRKQKLKQHA